MKQNKINRVILAWLLAMVFVLPLVARAVHIYGSGCGEEVCCHSGEHSSKQQPHDCDSCPICQFSFYSFTETDLLHHTAILTEYCCRVFIRYEESGFATLIHSAYLRAPPSCAPVYVLG